MLAAGKQESHPLRLGKNSALARFMHRFLSRSDESGGLRRRGGTRLRVGGPRKRTVGTLRRPTERNTVRADDFVAAVEYLCIIRASLSLSSNASCVSRQNEFG